MDHLNVICRSSSRGYYGPVMVQLYPIMCCLDSEVDIEGSKFSMNVRMFQALEWEILLVSFPDLFIWIYPMPQGSLLFYKTYGHKGFPGLVFPGKLANTNKTAWQELPCWCWHQLERNALVTSRSCSCERRRHPNLQKQCSLTAQNGGEWQPLLAGTTARFNPTLQMDHCLAWRCLGEKATSSWICRGGEGWKYTTDRIVAKRRSQ